MESYLSIEMQSAYSTAPVHWAGYCLSMKNDLQVLETYHFG